MYTISKNVGTQLHLASNNSNCSRFMNKYMPYLIDTLPASIYCFDYHIAIDHKKELLFIQIPKTAGNAIWPKVETQSIASDEDKLKHEQYILNNQKYLFKNGWMHHYKPKQFWLDTPGVGAPHIPLKYILEMNPYFQNYFIFTFVRNPFDRMYSAWMYLNNKGVCGDAGDIIYYEKYIKQYNNDFNQFLSHFDIETNNMIHFIPQCEFVSRNDGNSDTIDDCIDFIGKYENLENDYIKLCQLANIKPQKLDYINNSNDNSMHMANNPSEWKYKYFEYYTQDNITKVKNIFATDFQLFGYD